MASGTRRPPAWWSTLRNLYALHNVTAWRDALRFWIVRSGEGGALEWMELGDPRERIQPFHFEIHFGKEQARDRHYAEAIAAARERGQIVVRELFGFADLFCPVAADGQRRTFLFAGPFLREQPSWTWLCDRWRELSEQEPASASPDFVRFVHMVLALPVLDGELGAGLEELARMYAEFLGGQADADQHLRVDQLNRDVFDRNWPIHDWVDSAISPERFHLTPWFIEGELTDWMKDGMGITRLPTTAIALMPVDARTDKLDPMQTLVRNALIQRACIAFARTLDDTAATGLRDYGVSIITSCKRGRSVAQNRVELRQRARAFQQLVRERFSTHAVVGIGRSVAPGEPLDGSHREAVLALHMCVQLGRDILFHDEHSEGEEVGYAQVRKAATALMEAVASEKDTEIKLTSDRFVHAVLVYSDERLEVVRSQLLTMLFQIFEAIERRQPLNAKARDRFVADLPRPLEQAYSVSGVIAAFNDALRRLAFLSTRVLEGPKLVRIEAALQHLRENFAQTLRLPDEARRAGFSVPAYSRAFKAATGTSFLAYLRAIRVEHGKRLLLTTPMTTEQIGTACGFQSLHHFIRSFKKVTKRTPGAFRRQHGARAV